MKPMTRIQSKFCTALCLTAAVVLLAGCGGGNRRGGSTWGATTNKGLKPSGQIDPSLSGLAAGQQSLDQVMESPEVRAKGRHVVMNAIQDLPPAR